MADNNYDPKEVGGIQPIYCPYCQNEVKPLDSFHLSLQNKRYHYPACWQRHELDGDPPPKATSPEKRVLSPESQHSALSTQHSTDDSALETYHSGTKSKKK